MAYHDLPIICLDIIRGYTYRVHLWPILKNGQSVPDLENSEARIYLKRSLDISRNVMMEKTIANGGLEIHNGGFIMHISDTDFEVLSDGFYYGDLRMVIEGDNKVMYRLKAAVSGTATI